MSLEKRPLLCLEDKAQNWTIEGNLQDNFLYKRPNSYFSLEIYRCQNTDKEPKRCAGYDELNEWLYNKQLEPLAFNLRPSMSTMDQLTIESL